MYEKEEAKLKTYKNELDRIPLPLEKADSAIMEGMEKVKQEKQQKRIKRKRSIWTMTAAALIMLTLVVSIRVSPAFASAVAAIPGMDKIVELIHADKGLTAAIENDYYQEIGVSETEGNLTLTIGGVILDESGMNIFYTIRSPQSVENLQVQSISLENKQAVPPAGISYGHPQDENTVNVFSDRIDYKFADPKTFEDLNFTFHLDVALEGEGTSFSVPFEVPENVKPGVTYALDQEVVVESQRFTIEEVTIHPLRVGVKVSIDPDNTMKILQFEDMRLEDEEGEVWGSIQNGMSGQGVNETTEIYYLQSSYFEQPKNLFLRINKIQAVEKEKAHLEVDTEKNVLLNRPKDKKLQLGNSSKASADFFLTGLQHDDHTYGLVKSAVDADGKEVGISSVGMYTDEDGKHWDITFETTDYKNPLRLELFAYPNYIEGDIKLELNTPEK